MSSRGALQYVRFVWNVIGISDTSKTSNQEP